jgi:hypothetical protein
MGQFENEIARYCADKGIPREVVELYTKMMFSVAGSDLMAQLGFISGLISSPAAIERMGWAEKINKARGRGARAQIDVLLLVNNDTVELTPLARMQSDDHDADLRYLGKRCAEVRESLKNRSK